MNDAIVYSDEKVFAFHDINNGSAKVHILFCPVEHIPNVNSLNRSHLVLLQHMK